MKVSGYEERPDLPKMGPSLLIATALILAIRTARWPPLFDDRISDPALDREIDYSIHQATRILAQLMRQKEAMFPTRREARYAPEEDETPA